MKIIYLMKYWPAYGGGETVTRTLINEFVNRGHHVWLAHYQVNGAEIGCTVDERVKTWMFPGSEGKIRQNASALAELIRNEEIDFVISQWPALMYPIVRFLRDLDVKIVTCLHTAVKTENPQKGIKQSLRNWFPKLFGVLKDWKSKREHLRYCKSSDAYVVLSDVFVCELRKLLGNTCESRKITSIANPVNSVESGETLAKEKRILFVGRLVAVKRVEMILAAWEKIASNRCFDEWILSIVGDGESMELLRKIARDIPRVEFEGFKDPKAFYTRSKIFLMTSSFEGFGMTLVEAQQYGCVPVVMDSFSSLQDIVNHGSNGILTPNGDVNAFADSVMGLMADEKKLNLMASSAKENVSKFDIQLIADRWIELLASL